MVAQARLESLEQRHGELESELHLALSHPSTDDSLINEIKRKKLQLKDEMERLRSEPTRQ